MPKNATPHLVSKIPMSAKIANGVNALLKVRQLRAPPTNMNEIDNEQDRRVVNEVLIFINKLVKRTSQLENRMEVLDSYYKVHFEGFKERVSFVKLVEFQSAQNSKYKWNVVRDVYCEMDTNRIVVEVNKVCTKPYVSSAVNVPAAPPLPPKLLLMRQKKLENVDKNGRIFVVGEEDSEEKEEEEMDDGEFNELYNTGIVADVGEDDDLSDDDDERRQFVVIDEDDEQVLDHFHRPPFPVDEHVDLEKLPTPDESEVSFSDASFSMSPSRKRRRRHHRRHQATESEIELNDDYTPKRVRRNL